MIHIVLIIPNQQISATVIKRLKNEKLVMDLFTHSEEESAGSRIKITGITRAVLYPAIEKLLGDFFEDNQHILYSLPIVNMDWNNAQKVLATTKTPIHE